MPDVQGMKKRYETAEDLLSVVKMMKALAGANIRQYEQAEESLAGYVRGIDLAFRGLLRANPSWEAAPVEQGRTGLLVFGSDQGMCGQFNDRIAAHALNTLKGLSHPDHDIFILAVGQRVYDRLTGLGLTVSENIPVPVSVLSITPVIQEIIDIIDEWTRHQGLSGVILEYNHHMSGASYEPCSVRLLPLDREWFIGLKAEPWPTRCLPMFRMDHDLLFSLLVKHYLISSLYQAFAESLASENAARLASMQGAERNIKEKLLELKNQYNQERQNAITEELLDIISGFNALKGDKGERK